MPYQNSLIYSQSAEKSAYKIRIVCRTPWLPRLIAFAESREVKLYDPVSVIDASRCKIIQLKTCAPSLQDHHSSDAIINTFISRLFS